MTVVDQTWARGLAPGSRGSVSAFHNGGVGYQLLSPAQVEVLDGDVLLLTIDHGKAPKDASYAYAVRTAVSKKAFEKALKEQDFEILANAPDLQAVRFAGKVMAVFYEAGEIALAEGQSIESGVPSLVVRDLATGATVSWNPYCD